MRIGDAKACIGEKVMNTWILDPPYNIGFDYQSDFKDNKKPNVYASELVDIIWTCARSLRHDGSLFIIHYPEIISRLVSMIEYNPLMNSSELELHQWITWVYPSNIGHSKSKFTRASRAILWFKKRGQKPKFNHLATVQPYRNPNDKRIKQRIADGHEGVVHYDWWEINMCKNVSKDYRGYVNQIPYKLLERLILHTTDEGDWVGDCFAGSGSTIAAAQKLGRNGWGCDINPECEEYWYDLVWDDMDYTVSAEKQAEEAQRSREYGYVHPTIDDYDESLDDPNYEETEEPYEGDD